jgi:hypothetical protein
MRLTRVSLPGPALDLTAAEIRYRPYHGFDVLGGDQSGAFELPRRQVLATLIAAFRAPGSRAPGHGWSRG